MITDLSFRIVRTMIHNKIITHEQTEIYQYGFEIFFSSVITFLIVLLCGIITGCIIPSLTFFALFVVLRSLCGGYHADNYYTCNCIFTLVAFAVILSYKFLPLESFESLHIGISVFSVISTCAYAPVSNPNKPLTDERMKLFRYLSIVIVSFFVILSTMLIIYFESSYSILVDMTLLVVSFSMFVTKVKRGGEQIMDKKLKTSFLKTVAKVGEKSAKIGCNSASLFGFHQPKEPAQASKMLKK